MKANTMVVLIISLALVSSMMPSCTTYGYDEQGRPKGTLLATKAQGLKHDESGFYADAIDTREGYKDTMDFGGTLAGTYFGYKTVTDIADINAGVTNTETKTSGQVAQSKEVTKRNAANQKTIQQRDKLKAAEVVPPAQ